MAAYWRATRPEAIGHEVASALSTVANRLRAGGASAGSGPLEVRLDAGQLGVSPLRCAEVTGPVVDRGESSQYRVLLHWLVSSSATAADLF